MKATIGLELFCDIHRDRRSYVSGDLVHGYVAEILPGMRRKFLPGKVDTAKANGSGSRGMYRWFILSDGRYYEVLARTDWTDWSHYFCTISDGGDVVIVEEAEVLAWARSV
jgi:hypothetical protein